MMKPVSQQGIPTSKLTVPERLRALADLYEKKNEEYGDAYKNMDSLAMGMGLSALQGPNEERYITWDRLAILCVMMYKMQRYAARIYDGGHSDSLDDLAVYAMMLREIDDDQC